jgi:hypothetical protein
MDSREIAYIQPLINAPWTRHGLHCWKLVGDVQADLFGREIPFRDYHNCPPRERRKGLLSLRAEEYGWHEVSAPEHGAVVRMYREGGDPADLEHAGVFFAYQGGRVLHTDKPHGVVLDSLVELARRGWVPRWFVPTER